MHTPSLLTEGSTAAEVVCDGVNGFLTRNSRDAMAAKIREVISDRNLLRSAGLNAATSIAQSWEQIIDTVSQRYKMIIQRKHYELCNKQYIPLSENVVCM
jgi:glycosyltransferase involved in cell wall biosynthesis